MKMIKSKVKKLYIEAIRIFDHSYRQLFGLPVIKQSSITPHLYLGGQYTNLGLRRLKKIGITAIVNMRTNSIHKEISGLWFKYLHLPTIDQHAPTLGDLQKGTEFIGAEIKAGGKVYIHCKHGEGRGPTMAIAYLSKTGLNLNDAFNLVEKTRIFIRPTEKQLSVLKEFENLDANS